MKNINCIILAGGNSKRMTFPKEFIKIDEEYLIHRSIKTLKNFFDEIIVVSNEKEHYKDFDVKVVRDIFYKKGPMAGLHSGLSYSSTNYSYLLACDMPIIDIEFINFMVLEIDKNYEGLICISKDNTVLPMNGIYRNDLKYKLRLELLNDNRKFVKFIQDNNFKSLKYEKWEKFDKRNVFKNLNTKDELNFFKLTNF